MTMVRYGHDGALERHATNRPLHLIAMSYGRANPVRVEELVKVVALGRLPTTKIVRTLG